ncbi:hypothetical protein COV94_02005, partial [Candidatus Woesearchaeota archaeon CG11_big_fil_rev_8_21_14_0_20_57_5]
MHADIYVLGGRMRQRYIDLRYMPELAERTGPLGLEVTVTAVDGEPLTGGMLRSEPLPQGAILLAHGDYTNNHIGAHQAYEVHQARPDLAMVVTLGVTSPFRGIGERTDFGKEIAAALERGLDPSHWLSVWLGAMGDFIDLEGEGIVP